MDVVFLTRTNRPVAIKVLSEILREQNLNVKGVIAEETLKGKSLSFLKKRFLRQVRSYGFWNVLVRVLHLIGDKVMHSLRIGYTDGNLTFDDLREICDFKLHIVKNMHDLGTITLIREMEPEVGVVVGTGILKPDVFRIPKRGCINLHQGKVPEYRGGPPAFWELFNDERKIGVTIHFIDDKLDTGDIILQKEIDISPDDSLDSLQSKLNELGKHMVVEALLNIKDGTFKRIPQGCRRLKINRLPTKDQRKMLAKKLKERKRRREISAVSVDQDINPDGR